jgi:hypothetical protein
VDESNTTVTFGSTEDVPIAHSAPALKEMPEWMAIYDVADMAKMLKAPYTDLRKQPMQS